MKWKFSTFLLFGITIILCFTNLRQKQEISKLNAQSKVVGKTDTVYISKPFKVEPAFNTHQLPKYVFLYGDASSNKTVSNKNLLQSRQANKEDSLIQVILDRNDLFLSFKTPLDSSHFKLGYKINLDDYKYNWVNGKMTVQKIGPKLKFIPYLYAKYRPIHSMADLGIGLSLKTQRFQYKLGINGYYYPCLENKIGIDPEIQITYNLSK